MANNGKLNSFS